MLPIEAIHLQLMGMGDQQQLMVMGEFHLALVKGIEGDVGEGEEQLTDLPVDEDLVTIETDSQELVVVGERERDH